MKRLLVVLILLTLLAIAALPALAGTVNTDRLAPGWRLMSPTTSPAPRASQAMAYDSARGVAVLFGGTDGWTTFSDTWEWSSALLQWSQKFTTHVPPSRYGHAMVYDEARGVVVMFGGNGSGGGNYMNDLWEFDGSDWSEIVTVNAPSERWLHAMAYDPDRQVTVLHSGTWGLTVAGDTWEYANGNWVAQDIVNPGPPYRYGEGLAYDGQRGVMVLFGGHDDGYTEFNETWERVGSGDWTRVYPTQNPARRYRFGFVYNERIHLPFLFGGLADVFFGDVNIYNGQKWKGGVFSPGPAGRCCLAMVYDTTRQAVFLFGGSVGGLENNESWYFR
ncbi:MAG: hypothetical protein AB1791_18665 [Chloroflexota bacterium]